MQYFKYLFKNKIIMAANKERELEILRYRVEEHKRILNNWIAQDISPKKIEKMENKIAREEQAITDLENS